MIVIKMQNNKGRISSKFAVISKVRWEILRLCSVSVSIRQISSKHSFSIFIDNLPFFNRLNLPINTGIK